jgi:hypothetical protein
MAPFAGVSMVIVTLDSGVCAAIEFSVSDNANQTAAIDALTLLAPYISQQSYDTSSTGELL